MESAVQLNKKKLIFGIPQYEFLLLMIVHICALLTFVHNSAIHTLVCLVAIGCTCLLAFNPYLYLLLPVYMIFYEQIVPFGGIVGYRIYTLIVIASCLFNKKTRLSMKNVLFFLFLMLYTFSIVFPKDPNAVVMYVINFAFLVIFSDNYIVDSTKYRYFLAFLILSTILSAMYGFFGGDSAMENVMLVNGKYIEYSRFLATFNDPNYLGLIFNVAIFSTLCILKKNKKLRIAVLTICYIALLATLSVTAILINLGGLAVYFVFIRKMNPLIIPIMLIAVITVVSLYNFSLQNDMGFMTDFAYRIEQKLEGFNEGDMDKTTTGRTELSRQNMQKFEEKNIVGMLFGGSYITSTGKETKYFNGVSHNEFVDNLLFFGIIGTVVFWIYFIANFKSLLKRTREDHNLRDAMIFAKLIYICYCFTLTIFPDIRLMFLFFV